MGGGTKEDTCGGLVSKLLPTFEVVLDHALAPCSKVVGLMVLPNSGRHAILALPSVYTIPGHINMSTLQIESRRKE